MTKEQGWFEQAVTGLADPQNQRVWSIIVSLFGDLAQERGAQIAGGALTRVIEPMGIKPEAIRVALHRLRKDGWIESARNGRTSMHFLTPHGRAQSAQVSPRIYDRDPKVPDLWHLLIAEEGHGEKLDERVRARLCIALGRNVALGPGAPPTATGGLAAFEVTAHTAPDWLRTRLCPPELREACETLRDAARAAYETRPKGWEPSALQTATLRTLIVHRWRRVVLRQPDLPPALFPPDWPGPACRADVFRLLDTLPRPGLDQINAPG